MKQTLRNLLVVLLLIVGVISAGLVCFSVQYNYLLQQRFTNSEQAYPYADAVDTNELDMKTISSYFPDGVTLVRYNYQNEIRSPTVISYYADMKDEIPTLIIEKGEIISFKNEGWTQSVFSYRGTDSLPTNKAGWRLVKPFLVKGKEPTDELMYVKLNELLSVTAQWLQDNPGMERMLQNDVINQWMKEYPGMEGMLQRSIAKQMLRPTQRDISKFILLFADRILYTKGVFLSSDLKHPIISSAVIVCLIVFLILLLVLILIKFRNKRLRKHLDMSQK